MKITCDACGAKYSIADEKVAGKAFKIKCKKCSSAIVVRAEQAAAPAQEKPTTEAQWHVVVAGEQQGPLSTEKVGELIVSGAIDWDAYVWQEGYEDWKSARDVPELVNALQAPDAPTEHEVPASVVASAGVSQSDDDDDGPTRAQAAHDIHDMLSPVAQPKVSRASAAAGADLFAQATKEEVPPSPSDSPFSGSAFSAGLGAVGAQTSAKARPEEASAESLTGSRNETSVLFSLSNLKQLKTSTPPSKQASGASAGAAQSGGAATDDASGLIDIRALAAAASSTGASSASKGQKDSDLAESILQSHQGTVPLAPLAAPSLRPEPGSGPSQRVLIIGLSLVGLLALVAIALLVVFLTQKPEPAATVATGQAPVGAAPGEATPTTGTAAPPPAPGQAPSGAETTPAQAATDNEGDKATRESTSKERSSSRRSSSVSKTTPEPEPPKKSTGSIDDLLDQAIGTPGGSKTGGQTSSNLPDAPSRSDVTSAMRSVQGNVQSCGQGKTGVAQTSVSVSGSTGRVTSVQVGGAFAGTPTARCIGNAVKGARFPKFKRSSFSFVYPFRL